MSNFLTLDLVTNQKVIRSKKAILSSSNELANFESSSTIGLRVVAFKKVS